MEGIMMRRVSNEQPMQITPTMGVSRDVARIRILTSAGRTAPRPLNTIATNKFRRFKQN